MLRVTIIGGGVSGTLACMLLVQRFGNGVHVHLVEKRARRMHRGVAYSASLSQQLLNVPAGQMGLFPEAPDDFLHWVRSGPSPRAQADDFLPRMLYGDYVRDRFHEAARQHPRQVTIMHGEAVSLDHHAVKGHTVTLDGGRTIGADIVLLALGNAPPAHVPGLDPEMKGHPAYVPRPWRVGTLDGIGRDDHVLFIGAGLTMTDLLLSMRDAGHRGPVTVLSRNGRLPCPHTGPGSHALLQEPPRAPHTVAGLMRWLRHEVGLAAAMDVPWQHVMGAIKPLAQDWWRGLGNVERARFLRHARPHWEVHRHRMPRDVHARLTAMLDEGGMRLLAGRIHRVSADGGLARTVWIERGTGRSHELLADRVINCTGPQADTRRMDQPLMRDLLDKGLARWDALHLGLDLASNGALTGAMGHVSNDLFAIGPLCKATLWECTAVPEIRVQVAGLVEHLAGRAHREDAPRSVSARGSRVP